MLPADFDPQDAHGFIETYRHGVRLFRAYAPGRYDGTLTLRGVAFRSSRAEPFGEAFLRRALDHLLTGDLVAVQDAYLATVAALRKRTLPTRDVTARVRLTKSPEQYLATRDTRRELAYEAVLASGRTAWTIGEHVRVYRATRGRSRVFLEPDEDHGDDASAPLTPDAAEPDRSDGDELAAIASGLDRRGDLDAPHGRDPHDPRDYDVEHYLRVLRDTYAARFARALTPDDFAAIFADPDQPSLFARSLRDARPILTPLALPEPETASPTLHAIHRQDL